MSADNTHDHYRACDTQERIYPRQVEKCCKRCKFAIVDMDMFECLLLFSHAQDGQPIRRKKQTEQGIVECFVHPTMNPDDVCDRFEPKEDEG